MNRSFEFLLILTSFLLLIFLVYQSFIGFTIYDCVVYSKMRKVDKEVGEEIAAEIEEKIHNTALYETENPTILEQKTTRVSFDVNADTICLNERCFKFFEDETTLTFHLAPHLKRSP